MSARTRLLGLGGLALAPLVLLTAGPAQAAECLEYQAFLPGEWTGYGYRDLSSQTTSLTVSADEEGAFELSVDPSGAVVGGQLEIEGGGMMASGAIEGFSEARWRVLADLWGTGSVVEVQGEWTLAMGGAFDVSGDDEYVDWGTENTRDLSGTFSPLQVDCTMAWGSFDGVGFGDGIAWIAHRDGGASSSAETLQSIENVIQSANDLLAQPYPDMDLLATVTQRLITVNQLIAQSAECGGMPAGYRPGSPLAGFAQDLLAGALDRYLDAAVLGAYPVREIVYVTSLGLQAGAFEQPACGGDAVAATVRATLLGKLHEALADRIGALEEGSSDHLAVLSAAYQYGFTDLVGGAR